MRAQEEAPGPAAGGPLRGVRVLEFASLGPAPFCGMMLADMGAEIIRIDRVGGPPMAAEVDVMGRGRTSLELDLKSDAGLGVCREAIALADVLVEGYRPGVMERLGLGPKDAHAINPRLVYGRVTGWGREGPLAQAAGHDIDFVAMTGALAAMAAPGAAPRPPLNLVGDFGGGGMFLAFGIVAALFERSRSGQGQVVDAAMIDGVAALMANVAGLWAADRRALEPGRQLLGGAAPNYRCYECSDGRFIAVGPLEPHFYERLLEALGRPLGDEAATRDPDAWERHADALARVFRTRTREAWCERLAGLDACVAPVLTLEEARDHPHLAARGVYVTRDGVLQPAPAPRFSRTPGAIGGPAPATGAGGQARLDAWRRGP